MTPQSYIPPFSHYVVLKDMKASGQLYYRGQVIEPPPEWPSFSLQQLVDVRYLAPCPGEVETFIVTVEDVDRRFVNQAFAALAEKALKPNEQVNGRRRKAASS